MTNRMELSADVRLPRDVVRAGDLTGWQAAASAALDAPNCPHWRLGLAGGFVGPVLQLCGFETCGTDFSGPTSCGKTFAQQLAVSVWSSPALSSGGLLKPARFTENALELLARQSNGLVLALDELALIDGKTLGQVIYGLAAGVGKARMTVGLKLHRTIRWATFVLLSSEVPLEQKIRGDGGRWSGGMAARFADIDCSDVNRRVQQSTLAAVRGIFRNHGEAGRAFIRRFIDEGLNRERERLHQQILDMAAVIAGDDALGARTRSALPFALLAVCGKLAEEFEILPKGADIKSAVAWAWAGFVESEALDPETRAEANLRRFVAEHRDITLKKTAPGAFDAHNNRDAVGWYDDAAIYIPVDRIAEAAGGVLSERAIGRMLAKRELLIRNKIDRLTVRYVPKVGYVPCYALKLSEFGPTSGPLFDE